MIKKNWNVCKEIAKHLEDVTERIVYHYLYDTIKQHKWLALAAQGDPNTIAAIKEWPEYKTLNGTKVFVEENEKNLPIIGSVEKLKVAMWFINKIGSADEAINCIQAAAEAIKKLEAKDKVKE